jgi:RimJ/RimL family protein N-acetyltransferase
MSRSANDDVSLREIHDSDLPIFFEHQLDRDATRMAAFPSRDHEAFMTHWAKIRTDPANIVKTVLYCGQVAGHIGSWEQDGERLIGYWLGKDYWGKGIATAALTQLLEQLPVRPLFAHVAKHNAGSIRVLEKCGFSIKDDAVVDDAGDSNEEWIMALW